MAAFDIHPLRAGGGLVVDVQSDLIHILNTRVVVPLMPRERAPLPARRLNPVLTVEGETLILVTQYIAATPASELGDLAGSLAHEQDTIRTALDMLFLGF